MWGLTQLLRGVSGDMGFTTIVTWACGALFLASLAVDFKGIQAGGMLSFLSPSGPALFLFGASGGVPVFELGHWWTVLSAGWLHGGVLHILFNLYWVRSLIPATASLYGPGRAVIIYTVSSVIGFAASSVAYSFLPGLPNVLSGGRLTVGASAAILGLLGARLQYGRRTGSGQVTQQAIWLSSILIIFGFIMPGVDNWAHLGGFGGGFLTAKILNPLKPERGDHLVIAAICLAASLLAILASVFLGLGLLRAAFA
jgi:rhomboid protease GluP